MTIIQGTTPTLTIAIAEDIDISTATAVELSFKSGSTLTRKGLEDVTIDENSISYHFTQAETLAFSEDDILFWQLRVMVGGEIYGTTIQSISVEDLMSEVVLQ